MKKFEGHCFSECSYLITVAMQKGDPTIHYHPIELKYYCGQIDIRKWYISVYVYHEGKFIF